MAVTELCTKTNISISSARVCLASGITVRVDPLAPSLLPSPPSSPSMPRSPSTLEEAEQYYPGLSIRQCRYPPYHGHNSISSGSVHRPVCTPRVHISGLQTHSRQVTSHGSRRESPRITVPDRSDIEISETQCTPLLSPESVSGYQEGRESSFQYPCPGAANRAFQHTPDGALSQAEPRSEDEENPASTGSEGDEKCDGVGAIKAKRLSEKRKMKRFRSVSATLTHTLTIILIRSWWGPNP